MAKMMAVVSGDLTWMCFAKPAPWLALVCVLYFSAVCHPNAVRNLSMVTAQYLFLFKERKRSGFSARILTQVITLLPAEFPHSFNCSSCSSLPLLISVNIDLLLCFGNTAVAALLRQVKWPCYVFFMLDLPLVKTAASSHATLQLSSFWAWLWHNKLVLIVRQPAGSQWKDD